MLNDTGFSLSNASDVHENGLRYRHVWTNTSRRGQWCPVCTAWCERRRPWPKMIFLWQCTDQENLVHLRQEDNELPARDGRRHWYDAQYDWYFKLRDSIMKAYTGLLQRRYWSRRWIVQEINLPRESDVCFRWGVYSMSHQCFNTIVSYIGDGLTTQANRARNMLRNCREQDLFSLVGTMHSAHCSDPRDRLYALLSLVDRPPISPGESSFAAAVHSDRAVGPLKCLLTRVARSD